ncbi:MAG: hypothetical protein ACKO35_09060, partial [Planctomycetaceae bacterium]
MPGNTTRPVHRAALLSCASCIAPIMLSILTGWAGPIMAQGFGGFGQAVGGISIDTSGIVATLDGRALESLAEERRRVLASGGAPAGRNDFRKVSLAAIISAIDEARTGKRAASPDVLLLGGLEQVTHVFVDPDGHDIVLAG